MTHPDSYILYQNHPNPFNSLTSIIYQLPVSCLVSLKVYNVLGKEIETLKNEYHNSGKYVIKWNPGNLTSGIYICRLKAGDFTVTKKLILVN